MMINIVPVQPEKRVQVFLDNCFFDYLFKKNIDLSTELPVDRFQLFIPREIEFEIAPNEKDKPELAHFIRDTIDRAHIRTWRTFGFLDERFTEEDQRVGGFGDVNDSSVGGIFSSEDESKFHEELVAVYGQSRMRPTRLFNNEADIALAVRSLHSVVLTLDTKSGPLRDAKRKGGKVIFLNWGILIHRHYQHS